MVIHLDYEARSGVDITEVGSHRWSIDPKFEILMAAVSEDDSDEVLLWVNPLFGGSSENARVEEMIARGTMVYAHNATNEQANTWGALEQGKACPFRAMPPITIWRCTAAMARKAGLPASLEKVAEALGIAEQKDRRGKDLIRFFCIADEKTGTFNDPKDHSEKWAQFCAYCRQDVRTEKGVHRKLKAFELQGAALATFQFDLRMNQRGIPINLKAARNAQRIIDEVQSSVTAEFRELTGLNPTQGRKFLPWFNDKFGLSLPNLQATTVEETLPKLTGDAAHILSLYQKVSYAAVKKVQTMLDCVCPDGTVKGGHLYHGAGTGRWSGKLLQPQNFKKTPPEYRDLTDGLYALISKGVTSDQLSTLGEPLEFLSYCIRHFIDPQTEILDGDYNAVEARIICWLADERTALEEYRRGLDRYVLMAAEIYNTTEERIKSLGKDSTERQVGKHTILGCGFGLGREEKFVETCLKVGGIVVEKSLGKRCIEAYRKRHPKVVAYWHQLDNWCKDAIRYPGTTYGPFTVRNVAGIPYLLFRLRSGRSLAYPYPKIDLVPWEPKKSEESEEAPASSEVRYREQVTYWGQIPSSTQWGRIKLYGGKLAENEAQATAADLMAHGAITAEARGMAPFMLVHDQGLALRNGHTVAEFEAALGDLPAWAKGLPLKVEAKIAPYYRK